MKKLYYTDNLEGARQAMQDYYARGDSALAAANFMRGVLSGYGVQRAQDLHPAEYAPFIRTLGGEVIARFSRYAQLQDMLLEERDRLREESVVWDVADVMAVVKTWLGERAAHDQ